MAPYRPPFTITAKAAQALVSIHQRLGTLEGTFGTPAPIPKLRRENRIRTIKDTLAIEGNTLTTEQVTALLAGRHVVGPQREILEVQNADRAYEEIGSFDALSEQSLLDAHAIFMRELIPNAGKYRDGGVGIVKGKKVVHVAPPAARVPKLIKDLFNFLQTDQEAPALVQAAVFHYALEFIHPFDDGNGRLGRFWQHLLFQKASPILRYIPIESLIREHQPEYYQTLETCDRAGSCDLFIELMLNFADEGLRQITAHLQAPKPTPSTRLDVASQNLGNRWFHRKGYLEQFPNIATATASRDLKRGLKEGRLESKGSHRLTAYRFI